MPSSIGSVPNRTARIVRPDRSTTCPGSSPDSALEAILELPAPWDEDGIREALVEVGERHGFTHAALFSLPSTDEGGAATRYLAGNWSEAFQRAYEQHGLHRFKLVLGALRSDPLPFVWDVETLYGADEDDPPPAARMLVEAGYLAGVLLPVHGMTGFNGAVSFAGRSCDLTPRAERALHVFAMGLFSMLAAVRFEENRQNNPLTGRERDCLRLAMLGKTSSEIGIILELSEHTVSQYFTTAQRKLNASNRTHAVALAAQLGYLS